MNRTINIAAAVAGAAVEAVVADVCDCAEDGTVTSGGIGQ